MVGPEFVDSESVGPEFVGPVDVAVQKPGDRQAHKPVDEPVEIRPVAWQHPSKAGQRRPGL